MEPVNRLSEAKADSTAAVIGAGISGLVAAYRLRQKLGTEADIVVIDPDGIGGQLRTVELGGGPFDVGAEAFVRRRPEMVQLLEELGLSDLMVLPAGLRPIVWAGGAAHSLPAGSLMGLPTSGDSIRGFVSDEAVERVNSEPSRPFNWEPGSDCSVAELVGDRFGAEVVERCVDPLLGGVYAGTSATAGVRAALPTLAAALDAGAPNLTAAVVTAMGQPQSGPVFSGIEGGYQRLVQELIRQTAPRIASVAAQGIERYGSQWTVTNVGTFDIVVVAVRPAIASALFGREVPAAASALDRIPAASAVVVALALQDTVLPDISGVLVASGESLRAKAFTFSDRKWPHLRDRPNPVIRVSFGKFGDESILDETDEDLVRYALEDLRTVTGIDTTAVDSVVQRWVSALPQYLPGHLDVVAEIEEAIYAQPGLAIAGSYLNGVGVPACVGTATKAVNRLLG
ncbi:MAG: protoporphyrinogen oxidase [Nocardiaceae bacterium]|nr:protoporphyrinogen oxidase [Nocardiaceae bacterium]